MILSRSYSHLFSYSRSYLFHVKLCDTTTFSLGTLGKKTKHNDSLQCVNCDTKSAC